MAAPAAEIEASVGRVTRLLNRFGAGPRVAWLFHRLYSAVLFIAWADLIAQLRPLFGATGIRPARAGEPVLMAAAVTGAALALLALVGLRPRILIGVSVLLYASFSGPMGNFWNSPDDLLLLAGCAAVLLDPHRPAPWPQLFLKLVLFKLYFEPGLAKLLSPDGSWLSGAAMAHFYETLPLPSPLAANLYFAPEGLHHIESWTTLFVECVVPFAAFGPRALRLSAFVLLTGLQLAILSVANFGFLNVLSLAVNVSLLDDAVLARVAAALGRPTERVAPTTTGRLASWAGRASPPVVAGWLVLCLAVPVVPGLRNALDPLHVFTQFGMFDQVPQKRVQAEFQTFDGVTWSTARLVHQPWDPSRPPRHEVPYVPRLEFMAWFQANHPAKGFDPPIRETLAALCRPAHGDLQALFTTPLPDHPTAVRLAFEQFEWIAPAERAKEGAWWRRTALRESPPRTCEVVPAG